MTDCDGCGNSFEEVDLAMIQIKKEDKSYVMLFLCKDCLSDSGIDFEYIANNK